MRLEPVCRHPSLGQGGAGRGVKTEHNFNALLVMRSKSMVSRNVDGTKRVWMTFVKFDNHCKELLRLVHREVQE